MSNKVQKYFVLDSQGREHDVVAYGAQLEFEHGGLLVRFFDYSTTVVAVFLNPICYSPYATE